MLRQLGLLQLLLLCEGFLLSLLMLQQQHLLLTFLLHLGQLLKLLLLLDQPNCRLTAAGDDSGAAAQMCRILRHVVEHGPLQEPVHLDADRYGSRLVAGQAGQGLNEAEPEVGVAGQPAVRQGGQCGGPEAGLAAAGQVPGLQDVLDMGLRPPVRPSHTIKYCHVSNVINLNKI